MNDPHNVKAIRKTSPYIASLTREKFMYYEMRITAGLLCDGFSSEEAAARIRDENLFQYPTEKMVCGMARACLRRLELLNSQTLVQAIVTQPSEASKQVCLYALMKQHRLVWDFMITVIGEKYRLMDTAFGKIDVNTFMMRLQEQDESVAAWNVSTVEKIKQVLTRILVENGYIESFRSSHLNSVLITPVLENAIRSSEDTIALPAFNCLD